MRVGAACGLAFLGLTAVVCLAMPRAYEAQARSAFGERALGHARALAFLDESPGKDDRHAVVAGWLATEPSFVSAAITRQDGSAVARWPVGSTMPGAGKSEALSVVRVSDGYLAHHPIITDDGTRLTASVLLSSESLVRDLENVRWLFASIFLFTCGVFFVLTLYLTRTILEPIEQIGRAAMDLADGEPLVNVPMTGDREIDDLGNFIRTLGENRRHSRVMENPLDVLSRRSRKRAGKTGGDLAPKRLSDQDGE